MLSRESKDGKPVALTIAKEEIVSHAHLHEASYSLLAAGILSGRATL